MAEIRLDVYSDQHGAPAELNKTKAALAGVEAQGEKTNAGLGRLWQQFAGGQIAVNLATKALSVGWNELKSTVSAAAEAERVERSLAAALEITGRSTPVREFTEYATSLQSVTTYDDEAIASVETLLVQMTKLDNDGLKKATKGAIGLASVLGMDLQSAGQLVQKALEGNTAALSRYGIRIDETLPKAEKQRQILERLGEMYKRAEADTDSYAGRLKQLDNAYDDLKETTGKFVIENDAVRTGIQDLITIVEYLKLKTEEAGRSGDSWTTYVGGVREATVVLRMFASHAKAVVEDEKRWEEELNSHAAAWGNWHGWLEKDNAALKLMGDSVDEFMGKLKPVKSGIEGMTEAQAELLKGLKVTYGDEVRTKINEAEAALAAYIRTGRTTPEGIKVLEDYIDKLSASLWRSVPALTASQQAIKKGLLEYNFLQGTLDPNPVFLKEVEKPFTTLGSLIGGAVGELVDFKDSTEDMTFEFNKFARAIDKYAKQSDLQKAIYDQERAIEEMKKGGYSDAEIKRATDDLARMRKEASNISGWEKAMTAVQAYAAVVINGLGNIAGQIETNATIRVENEYKKRLDYINKTISSETKKQRAIEALEAEYEIKKTSAKRKAAVQTKAVSIMEATVNTASAVTEALPNIPLSILIGALGAIQIGLIAAQPIPLAKGGLFNQRTVLPTGYEVAEAGSREIVSPEPLMRQIVRQESRTTNESVNLHVHFTINALDGASVEQMLRTTGIPMIQQALDRRVLRVAQA